MVGKKLGIVIGTNEYSDSKISNLRYAEKDAKEIKEILLDSNICGFDGVIESINKTRTQTFCNIDQLLKKAENDDLILIYFSGHGEPDPQHDLCLLFNNTRLDSLLPTSLNYSMVKKSIDTSLCKTVIVILDCCYSGAAGIKGNNLTEILDKTVNKVTDDDKNISGSGKVILSACSEFDIAKEDEKLENSVFTYYLIDGLKNGKVACDIDGSINLDDLYYYASNNTKKNHYQTPYRKVECEGKIIIGKNPLFRNTEFPKTFTSSSMGIEFVLVPVGKFMMGSPSDEKGRYIYEGPVHEVTFKNYFYMGKYPVTQKQWKQLMGNTPSGFNGENLPVENVSWNDVQEFIKRINEKEGTDKYRLPSEAEWEYACRADTTTRYSFDESKLDDYVWYYNNSSGKTNPVGQKKPNIWGFYDMHGNVMEWVQDSWHSSYHNAPSDGSAWEDERGSERIFRGGCWSQKAGYCRSAVRLRRSPRHRSSNLGFRLLREL